MDGSTPPTPGCQFSLLHPGKNQCSHGELYLPVVVWHPPGDPGRRDIVFYLDGSTLCWEIVWKGTMENGTNTTKDFLCWVVPVGILTEKDKHVAEEPPKHLYSKKLHLFLIHRKITHFMWKQCPLFHCQAKTHILYSDLNLPFSVLQLHTEIPLGIQMFLMLIFMLHFI